jgi:hypothetical protein
MAALTYSHKLSDKVSDPSAPLEQISVIDFIETRAVDTLECPETHPTVLRNALVFQNGRVLEGQPSAVFCSRLEGETQVQLFLCSLALPALR